MNATHFVDRLSYRKETLANGIALYHVPTNDDFVNIAFHVPFGSIHNTDPWKPGMAHFFEHIILKRSKKFPEYYGYKKWVSLKGGYVNAFTSYNETTFILSIPTRFAHEALEGFYSILAEPLFNSDDIEKEKDIVKNERKRKGRFWPGKGMLGHYIITTWRDSLVVSLRQIFGSDHDLDSITLKDIEALHKVYITKNAYIVSGGNYPVADIAAIFSKILTNTIDRQVPPLPAIQHPLPYHEQGYIHQKNYLYIAGNSFTCSDPLALFILQFGMEYISNSSTGVLMQWLRHEKGWTYGVSTSIQHHHQDQYFWKTEINVNTHKQSQEVRTKWKEIVLHALDDLGGISREAEKRSHALVYSYQTLETKLEKTEDSITKFEKPITEKDIISYLETIKNDPHIVHAYFNTYIFAEPHREFLAKPLKWYDPIALCNYIYRYIKTKNYSRM